MLEAIREVVWLFWTGPIVNLSGGTPLLRRAPTYDLAPQPKPLKLEQRAQKINFSLYRTDKGLVPRRARQAGNPRMT